MPKRIVLIRHGESLWYLQNSFTGWTDVDLTDKGLEEAKSAGKILIHHASHFTIAYTSPLKRAIKSKNIILDEMNMEWIPTPKTWRLNERHYGMLQGLNKDTTAQNIGTKSVNEWCRSYDIPTGCPNVYEFNEDLQLINDYFLNK